MTVRDILGAGISRPACRQAYEATVQIITPADSLFQTLLLTVRR